MNFQLAEMFSLSCVDRTKLCVRVVPGMRPDRVKGQQGLHDAVACGAEGEPWSGVIGAHVCMGAYSRTEGELLLYYCIVTIVTNLHSDAKTILRDI